MSARNDAIKKAKSKGNGREMHMTGSWDSPRRMMESLDEMKKHPRMTGYTTVLHGRTSRKTGKAGQKD